MPRRERGVTASARDDRIHPRATKLHARWGLAAAAACLLLIPGIAGASTILFNTDTGTFTVDNVVASSLHGSAGDLSNPVTAPIVLTNFVMAATGLQSYSGQLPTGPLNAVSAILDLNGIYSPFVPPTGSVPTYLGSPNNGALIANNAISQSLLAAVLLYGKSSTDGVLIAQNGTYGWNGQAGIPGGSGGIGANGLGSAPAGGAAGEAGFGGRAGGVVQGFTISGLALRGAGLSRILRGVC